ncbi:hypothetical protein [Cupriavidus campinensis]|uniref:Uncharacterized protein n=1 Tax=Cupriavidus campinensis TaxID=151783 RepID=A0ABY3EI94_9BURK|nr:hypothetical protein [Cupriavidus campinensis]TSP10651.1 hypothetical protein FGG12_21405 [Cupriavidus campinensis]
MTFGWPVISSALSGEWMLKRCFSTNGGDVIVGRALYITLWVYLLAVGLQALIDPARVVPSFDAFREQLLELAPLAGAVFGGAYLALYARFSSQWGYLAGVYNQIKQVEASEKELNKEALATWQAGFIEDAQNLHLAYKESIAPIIHAWGKKSEVAAAFEAYAPGGRKRFDALMEGVKAACRAAETRYK